MFETKFCYKMRDTENIDWKGITNKEEVIKLIKQREEIEDKIFELDEKALINYELEMLNRH